MRPTSRRFMPYLGLLRTIAQDANEPTPVRLRACELCLALLSGQWEIAATKVTRKAMRELAAQDDIDRQLLNLPGMGKIQPHQQEPPAPETPESTVDTLIAQAGVERKKKQKLEQLRGIAADESLPQTLRAAAQQQLHDLGESHEVEQTRQLAQSAEDDPAARIKDVFDQLLALGESDQPVITKNVPVAEQKGVSPVALPGVVCPACRFRQPTSRMLCAVCGVRLKHDESEEPQPEREPEAEPKEPAEPEPEPISKEATEQGFVDVRKFNALFEHQLARLKSEQLEAAVG